MWTARCVAILLVAVMVTVSPRAHADPQSTVGLTIGGAGVGAEGEFWDHAEFHLGLRGDILFARCDPTDFGVGPYVEVGTFAFDELQMGGGASLLMPIHEALPLIASFGAYGRVADDEFGGEPGVAGTLFWGTRSYNFHDNYVLTAGLLFGWRQSLGDSQESHFWIAAQIDLAVLALPFVALVSLMRGPSEEAQPLEKE
jgi:hypothetical protein